MNSLAQLVGRGAFACSFAFALLACSPSETAAVATSPLLGAQVGHADAAPPSVPVADSGRFRSEYSAAKECMDQTAVGELPSDVKFVFVDGIFDLPHFGHQGFILGAMQKAIEVLGAPEGDIRMIVGVSGSPDEIAAYKRKSVYEYAEKKRQLCGFRGVYRVINSAMVTTGTFIDAHRISLVLAGSDYEDVEKARRYYAAAIDRKIFNTVPRTPSISTTDLMRRVTQNVTQIIRQKFAGDADVVKTLDAFQKLLETL